MNKRGMGALIRSLDMALCFLDRGGAVKPARR
jgi:hypothetical protein